MSLVLSVVGIDIICKTIISIVIASFINNCSLTSLQDLLSSETRMVPRPRFWRQCHKNVFFFFVKDSGKRSPHIPTMPFKASIVKNLFGISVSYFQLLECILQAV
jgi:hypothetical protein